MEGMTKQSSNNIDIDRVVQLYTFNNAEMCFSSCVYVDPETREQRHIKSKSVRIQHRDTAKYLIVAAHYDILGYIIAFK